MPGGPPPAVRTLLEDPTVLKVGVGIMQDAARLARDYGIKMRGAVEVRDLFDLGSTDTATTSTATTTSSSSRALQPENLWRPAARGGASLQRLAREVLGIELDKTQQLSDWAAPALTREQVAYAAADAWASRELALAAHSLRCARERAVRARQRGEQGGQGRRRGGALRGDQSYSWHETGEVVAPQEQQQHQEHGPGQEPESALWQHDEGGFEPCDEGGGEECEEECWEATAVQFLVGFARCYSGPVNTDWAAANGADGARRQWPHQVPHKQRRQHLQGQHQEKEKEKMHEGDVNLQQQQQQQQQADLQQPQADLQRDRSQAERERRLPRAAPNLIRLPVKKGPLYDNCRIQAPDGTVLSTCGRSKVDWYVSRGLAEVVPGEPGTVRLKFEPRGRGHSDDQYYLADKDNVCAVCGRGSEVLRKSIVPHW